MVLEFEAGSEETDGTDKSRDSEWANRVIAELEKVELGELAKFFDSINQRLCMFRGELTQNMVSVIRPLSV